MVNSKSRAITLLAALLIGAIVIVVSLSALGLFDPMPGGVQIWQQELDPIQVISQSSEVRWLHEELPQSPLSVRLTAGYDSGELDSAYGLVLGQGDENIAVMVSPLGYTAIRQQPSFTNSDETDYYLPWQTWPHVHTADEANELFVYLDGHTITVRLNREWLWEAGEIERVDRIGLIAESYGEDVLIDFHTAELTAVDSGK